MKAETLLQWAKESGFSLAAVSAGQSNGAAPAQCRSFLVTGLVYGNVFHAEPEEEPPTAPALIAPFAQRNYYRAVVQKLQCIAARLRREHGGTRADYRIYCNSLTLDERRIAFESGMAEIGRNTLLLTKDFGSLFAAGILTLPFEVETGRKPERTPFALCADCNPDDPPCKKACPTGALSGDGHIEKERCIQWYLSGHGDTIPAAVKKRWGNRLYGCTRCQDACVHHRKPVCGVDCDLGVLPAVMDARLIADASGDTLKKMFHGTALGLSWLCPAALRRNAEMCLTAASG